VCNSIREAYDRAAADYAAAMWDEIDKKHFDRVILGWLASQVPPGETVLELGCGPGEVSGYLSRLGVRCLATDLSSQMVAQGKRLFPPVQFEVQDFFHLRYADASFPAVVAFYAIVNLTLDEVRAMLAEAQRVLNPGGVLLFTFHVFEKDERTDVEHFFNPQGGPLTFYYFKVEEIKALVEDLGFQVVDILTRYPYKDVEYQSKRAYVIVRKE
jgi:ubiquinone/menaquinone biosynthesis C-methylase UbiE